jgi:hypothetical protein
MVTNLAQILEATPGAFQLAEGAFRLEAQD